MTLVLAIASATPQVSVALGDGTGGFVGSVVLHQGRRHGEVLSPAIQSLCRLSDVALSEVGSIAVDVGPGLFTGLRVGVATAKALASGLGVSVVAVSSLELVAHPLRLNGRPVVSVVDARRGEVFWSRYDVSDTGLVAVSEPSVSTPGDLRAALGTLTATSSGLILAGDGARRYREILSSVPGVTIADESFDHPSAASLLHFAGHRAAVEPEAVTPLYLRGADVRIGWEQRHV